MLRMMFAGVVLALAVPAAWPMAAPAEAAGRVDVANPDGDAVVDPTYATTVTVRGTGFQSVRAGHGGIYVFFGAIKGNGWQPSKGGSTGSDYWYVPDTEAKQNQGFQKYVAFPGSDTASSANGGVMTDAGAWSTTLVVPGATFRAYDRDNDVRTIDCRKMTCGVLTIGAHGVDSARNETFTPVRFASLYAAQPAPDAPDATTQPDTTAVDPAVEAPGTGDPTGPKKAKGDQRAVVEPTLEVDRASAMAGNVLAFTASGLPPGRQVTVVFDDGAAGAGPFAVGADGTLAGLITLPEDTAAGTHELRVHGVEPAPSVRFAVAPGEGELATVAETSGVDRAGIVFAVGCGLVLLAAVVGRLVRNRTVRRAA